MENDSSSNKLHDGEIIIGTFHCPHCGSYLERYMWSAVLQLEVNDNISILAIGNNIIKQERIVSLLKTLGCIEMERKKEIVSINGKECTALKIVIGKVAKKT